MKERNEYSRIVQRVAPWEKLKKGKIIELFQHCVAQEITSFLHENYFRRKATGDLIGEALSESGLSRDEIQLICKMPEEAAKELSLFDIVENELLQLETDYLDLFLLNKKELSSEDISSLERLLYQAKIKEIGGINFEKQHIEKLEKYIPIRANFIKPEVTFLKFIDEIPKFCSEKVDGFIKIENDLISVKSKDQENLFQELSEKYAVGSNQLFLTWMLKKFPDLHLVLSYSEEDQISATTASKHLYLAPVDINKIDSVFNL